MSEKFMIEEIKKLEAENELLKSLRQPNGLHCYGCKAFEELSDKLIASMRRVDDLKKELKLSKDHCDWLYNRRARSSL